MLVLASFLIKALDTRVRSAPPHGDWPPPPIQVRCVLLARAPRAPRLAGQRAVGMTHSASARVERDLNSVARRTAAGSRACLREQHRPHANRSRHHREESVGRSCLSGRWKGLRREHHSRLLEHPFGRALAPTGWRARG